MNSIDEIFDIAEWDERITFIKNARRTPMPDVSKLQDDWFPNRHRVHDKEFRKDMKTLVKDSYIDSNGKEYPAEFETEEVARISLPIEQDIVNIHVAFTVGNEPQLKSDTEDEKEKDILKTVKGIFRENKMRFQNKRELRSWLSEKEVCEYWYRVENDSFWHKMWNKIASLIGMETMPKYKLKMQVWSPFRGDRMYPIFSDEGDDYLGIGREYEYQLPNKSTKKCFMLVTGNMVYQVENINGTWQDSDGYPFSHGFKKNPTIYSYRRETLCENIREARESLETLTSDFSDAIKMNFFPKLILEGDMENGGAVNIGKSHMLKITNGGKAYYLDWNQTSDMVKTQIDNLLVRCYSLTNTPLISFDQLKGTGQFPSGTAFDFMFMATLFAVERHWEDMGEFFQRRVNFLISAIGSLVPTLSEASVTIDVDVVQRPYRIEDLSKRISDATNGVNAHVMSRKQGVMLVGIADEYTDELEEIQNDMEAEKKDPQNAKE